VHLPSSTLSALSSTTSTVPTTPLLINLGFSSIKSQLLFTFVAPDTRGLRYASNFTGHRLRASAASTLVHRINYTSATSTPVRRINYTSAASTPVRRVDTSPPRRV
jgi:hypothetical protein